MKIQLPGMPTTFLEVEAGTLFAVNIERAMRYCVKGQLREADAPAQAFCVVLAPGLRDCGGLPCVISANVVADQPFMAYPDAMMASSDMLPEIRQGEPGDIFNFDGRLHMMVLAPGVHGRILKLDLENGDLSAAGPVSTGKSLVWRRWQIIQSEPATKYQVLAEYPPKKAEK